MTPRSAPTVSCKLCAGRARGVVYPDLVGIVARVMPAKNQRRSLAGRPGALTLTGNGVTRAVSIGTLSICKTWTPSDLPFIYYLLQKVRFMSNYF